MSKLDHIGVVVKSIDEALKLYSGLLGIDPAGEEVIEARGIKVCFLDVDGVKIELLQPIREDSEISSYLEKKGEGLHHLAYNVENVKELIGKAKELGIKPLTDEPKPGAHNTQVVFIHPKTANGVLTELVQH
ncbi:MAG TPA: methylmalonyl-CoA epimerase [Victivallales bacterium]|nr:methylmalonyl-CoA epimerase [Victivallales bacterium]